MWVYWFPIFRHNTYFQVQIVICVPKELSSLTSIRFGMVLLSTHFEKMWQVLSKLLQKGVSLQPMFYGLIIILVYSQMQCNVTCWLAYKWINESFIDGYCHISFFLDNCNDFCMALRWWNCLLPELTRPGQTSLRNRWCCKLIVI